MFSLILDQSSCARTSSLSTAILVYVRNMHR